MYSLRDPEKIFVLCLGKVPPRRILHLIFVILHSIFVIQIILTLNTMFFEASLFVCGMHGSFCLYVGCMSVFMEFMHSLLLILRSNHNTSK